MGDLEYVKEVSQRPEVKRVIRALDRLEKIWPHDQPIMLYSMAGTIHLLASREDGSRTIQKEGPNGWGIDPNLSIETFIIPNDGGDW